MINTIDQDESLKKFLGLAVGLHITIILVAFISQFILGWNIFNTKPDVTDVQVIQAAVRIDVVGMPKYTLQELKKMNLEQGNVEPEVKEESKSTETSKVEFKKQSKKVNLGNILNSYSGKKIKKVEKKKKKYDKAALNKLVLEGNIVSKGVSATGDNNAEIDSEFKSYVQLLPDKVRRFWKLPSYLKEQELNCRIQISINESGEVIKMDLIQSSGEKEYDDRAMKAIKLASPLPRPPALALARVVNGDVILAFPL